ncbi:MAG: hypothetical protein DRI90_15535 [Deltaproteobacteria bacterium]|nr:MAG: hypothetical protein DRI90_15535 [Deltaproteobacteria bacterium]
MGLAALVALGGCGRASSGVGPQSPAIEPVVTGILRPPESRPSKPRPEPAEIVWETAIQVAFERARHEGRALLVFVHAGWNVASREMVRDVWHDLQVRRAVRAVVPLNVDVTEATRQDEERITRLGVETLPTVLLLDEAGQPIGNLAGRCDAAAVLALLDQALQR